jgi:uncharacterized protein with GYD domain
MPHYLLQVGYNVEGVSGLVGNPQDRLDAIRPAVEGLGGKVESFYYALGDYDVVAICDFPDNVTAAAFSMATTAGGALSSYKTTPLLTAEEGVQAMQKAGSTGYTPPSG